MRCMIAGPLPTDTRTLMCHFGYAEHHTAGMGLTFIRPAHDAAFPRFHAKVAETPEGGFCINVHLDQATFNGEGNHRFVWAYRNPHLEEEAKRLLLAMDKLRKRLQAGEIIAFAPQPAPAPERMGMIAKLFRLM